MDYISQHPIEFFWLGVAIVCGIIEALTLGLTTIWFSGAAIVAMVAAFLGASLGVQIGLFAVVSAVFILFTRKLLVNKMQLGKEKTNVDALIGETAQVISTVKFSKLGRVMIGGQEWAAISSEENEIFQKGQNVKVVGIEGVKAIITKLDDEK